MAEPEAEPLTDSEQRQMAEAVAYWADRHPRRNDRLFAFGDAAPFSPLELAEALHGIDGPLARRFFRMAQFALEVDTFEGLLGGFFGSEGARLQ